MAAGLGFKTFTSGEVLTAADTNGYLMQGINVFANASARNAAITSPQEGQYCYLKDTNSTEYYDGAAWVSGVEGDISGVTAGTGISGGGTSGTVTITNSMATEITAKGDLIVGTGSATFDNLAAGSNGNSLVADSTTATGLAYAPNGLTQPIINGAFDIAQRGTTTGTMSSTYLLDRWVASTSSGVGTQAQVTGLTVGTEVFRYAWKFTALGAYTFVQMGTQIEFANCYQLQNQQVTISFYAQANNANAASTSLIVRTRTSASVDASVLFTGTVASTNQTITTTGTRYSITRTLPATFGALSLEFASGTSGIAGDGFTSCEFLN